MPGYPKIWTTLRSSAKYRALKNAARGALLQTLIWCKDERDDGFILAESITKIAIEWGTNRKTAAKLIEVLRTSEFILVGKNAHGQLVIEIPMYMEMQKITAKQMVKRPRDRCALLEQNSAKKIPQTRPYNHITDSRAKSGELENVDNSKEKKESGNPKLDDYRKWKKEHQSELVAISKTYPGGVEWVKSHTQDIERDIILNPVKYEPISGETWANWVKGWLKRAAEQNQAGNSGLKEPMTAAQEAKHYEQHRDNAGTRGSSEPTALGDVTKKLTGE